MSYSFLKPFSHPFSVCSWLIIFSCRPKTPNRLGPSFLLRPSSFLFISQFLFFYTNLSFSVSSFCCLFQAMALKPYLPFQLTTCLVCLFFFNSLLKTSWIPDKALLSGAEAKCLLNESATEESLSLLLPFTMARLKSPRTSFGLWRWRGELMLFLSFSHKFQIINY